MTDETTRPTVGETASGREGKSPKARNFHEGFRDEAVTPPQPAATGYVFACVALIVAVLFRSNIPVLISALAIAAAFAATARFAPGWLGPLNIVWFRFALLLNRIMSPLVMFILFACVVVPYGLAMQLVRDPLRRRVRGDAASFWLKRHGETLGSMRNQF